MTTTVEELRKELNADLGACHLALFQDDRGVEEKIDAFAAAVIQAERRRILNNSLFQFGMGDGTYMMIRTSVVDPKEKP